MDISVLTYLQPLHHLGCAPELLINITRVILMFFNTGISNKVKQSQYLAVRAFSAH